MIERNDYLTPNQAGKRMGVSGQTIRRWVAAGLLPAIRQPSGRILIHKDHAVVRPSN